MTLCQGEMIDVHVLLVCLGDRPDFVSVVYRMEKGIDEHMDSPLPHPVIYVS
jgi:hypothetical protein